MGSDQSYGIGDAHYAHLSDALNVSFTVRPELRQLLDSEKFRGDIHTQLRDFRQELYTQAFKERGTFVAPCGPLEPHIRDRDAFKQQFAPAGYLYHGAGSGTSKPSEAQKALIERGIDYKQIEEGRSGGLQAFGPGFYTTPDPEYARGYGPIVPFEISESAQALVAEVDGKTDRAELNHLCGVNMIVDTHPMIIGPGAVTVPSAVVNSQGAQRSEIIQTYINAAVIPPQ